MSQIGFSDEEIKQTIDRARDYFDEQKTPFDPHEFEQMFDREFLLTVIGYSTRDRMLREVQERYGTLNEPRKKLDGTISEIVSREPYHCVHYIIGSLKRATYEDGTPVGQSIPKALRQYIFKLEGVEFPENQPPILRGRANEYDLHSNATLLPEIKIILYMAENPTYKMRIVVSCL